MRLFFIILLFGVFALSCDKEIQSGDDVISALLCSPVIISSDFYQDLDSNQVSLTEVSIEGDCLTVKLGVSGCVLDRVINMISSGEIAESNPPQITFELQDEIPQLCQAFFMIERQFDLSPIRNLFEDDIIIRFRDSDKLILYKA